MAKESTKKSTVSKKANETKNKKTVSKKGATKTEVKKVVKTPVETKKVTYNKPVATETPVDIVKTFTLTVEVKSSASWIKLDIDGQNKVSKVVEPSKQTYDVKDKFYIITGKAANTTISMNGESLAWKTNSTTGVAEITCTIVSNALSCE